MNWYDVKHPMSERDIVQVEKKLKVQLPEDYKNIIGKINGGALPFAYINHPVLGEIAYSRNVSLSKKDKGNIYGIYGIMKRDGKNIFPFGHVGNGDYFCFDLQKKEVVLWEHETDQADYVCKTFSDLMQMLCNI